MFSNKNKNEDGVWEISPRELFENLKAAKIIDVRRPEEWTGELGHIEGSELVTLETDFKKTLDSWDKDEPYVFVCRSGGRSGRAALYLQGVGFKNVYNLEGGMSRWNELGFPVSK